MEEVRGFFFDQDAEPIFATKPADHIPTVEIKVGDCLDVLRAMPDQSVQCMVTSPPYYAMRDYGVEGQLGGEPTLTQYIDNLRRVFRELWRVLRDDGTVWLNIGDTYAASAAGLGQWTKHKTSAEGFKRKDLMLVPHRLAIALQDDGWTVRNDIIWWKPLPAPTSATDRATNTHEHVFLLTKRDEYYYDQEAVREQPKGHRGQMKSFHKAYGERKRPWMVDGEVGANMRDVWRISTEAYPTESHLATFPAELPAKCIRAGTSAKGCCEACGAPYKRLIPRKHQRSGWLATCSCEAPVVPCKVLDIFGGCGTTGVAAALLGRQATLIELSRHYAEDARRRLTLRSIPVTITTAGLSKRKVKRR